MKYFGVMPSDCAFANILNVTEMSAGDFLQFRAVFQAITMVLAGMGGEYFFGRYLLPRLPLKEAHRMWILAQVVFPLLVTVGMFGGISCAPILVLGMWKCGFPEITMYFLRSQAADRSTMQRILNLSNGVAMLLHHSTSCCMQAWFSVSPLNKYETGPCIPLIMQHWLSALRYSKVKWVNTYCYVSGNLILELWFQYLVVVSFNHAATYVQVCSHTIIIAHWMFWVNGVISSVVGDDGLESEEEEEFTTRLNSEEGIPHNSRDVGTWLEGWLQEECNASPKSPKRKKRNTVSEMTSVFFQNGSPGQAPITAVVFPLEYFE